MEVVICFKIWCKDTTKKIHQYNRMDYGQLQLGDSVMSKYTLSCIMNHYMLIL